MAGSDLLLAGVLFLFAAVIAVPLASRLGIGAVLGYLLAGIAIGPWGLGFISDVDEILHFSELGVVFLMFIIGLELNPAKLWRLRSSIFGVGAAQVMLSAAILGGLLMTTGFSWQAAVVGGIGLAMSSTAMALQLMREKGMSRSESGQLGFSVLLFQDLAVIPALALVPLLAGSADEHVNWLTVGMKVLAFAGMLIGGRYLLRPVFRFIASSGVREVFTAATLLLVLGSALFMEALGLSMALGTFIAGVLLALAIPARSQVKLDRAPGWFAARARRADDRYDPGEPDIVQKEYLSEVAEIGRVSRLSIPPITRLDHRLHIPVYFFILPLFAFSNASVVLTGMDLLSIVTNPVTIGVFCGLLFGKPLGIFLATWLTVKLKLSDLPQGVNWGHIGGVSVLGGVGFTMAIFVANLAFVDPNMIAMAKAAILAASLIAGIAGFFILRAVTDEEDEEPVR